MAWTISHSGRLRGQRGFERCSLRALSPDSVHGQSLAGSAPFVPAVGNAERVIEGAGFAIQLIWQWVRVSVVVRKAAV